MAATGRWLWPGAADLHLHQPRPGKKRRTEGEKGLRPVSSRWTNVGSTADRALRCMIDTEGGGRGLEARCRLTRRSMSQITGSRRGKDRRRGKTAASSEKKNGRSREARGRSGDCVAKTRRAGCRSVPRPVPAGDELRRPDGRSKGECKKKRANEGRGRDKTREERREEKEGHEARGRADQGKGRRRTKGLGVAVMHALSTLQVQVRGGYPGGFLRGGQAAAVGSGGPARASSASQEGGAELPPRFIIRGRVTAPARRRLRAAAACTRRDYTAGSPPAPRRGRRSVPVRSVRGGHAHRGESCSIPRWQVGKRVRASTSDACVGQVAATSTIFSLPTQTLGSIGNLFVCWVSAALLPAIHCFKTATPYGWHGLVWASEGRRRAWGSTSRCSGRLSHSCTRRSGPSTAHCPGALFLHDGCAHTKYSSNPRPAPPHLARF